MLFLPRKSLFEDIPILKASSWKDSELSTASLDGLKELLPSDEIDLSRNVDLLATSFNGCNINLVNRNGDAIDSETAVQIIDLFKHKPVNIEHKGPKIVGHIVKSAFSTFEDDTKIISAADVKNSDDVFNVALGSVVYRHLHREFAELLIKAADPKDKLYQKVSTSWEISFRDFHLVLGSRYLKEAEIISDPKQISEMKKHLKKYGGSGFLPDGKTPVYRKVLGPDVLPTAFAYVSAPAASVKGVLVEDGKPKKTTAAISLFAPKEKKCVIKDKTLNHNMDIEQVIQEMAASVKQLVSENKSEEATASVRKTIESAIKEANKEFIMERDKARGEREASEAKLTELYAQVEKMSDKMMKAEKKMYEMEEQSRAAKTMIRFNERMAAMSDEYEMDEEDCAVVASELKALEVKDEDEKDEVFAAYKNKMSKLWKHKNKTAKAAYQKELDEKVQAEVTKKLAELSTASANKSDEGKTVEDALDKAKASEEKSVSNNNETISAEKTLAERFGSALKVKISH